MDIVERLRLGGPNAWEVYGEAADEIERLREHKRRQADDIMPCFACRRGGECLARKYGFGSIDRRCEQAATDMPFNQTNRITGMVVGVVIILLPIIIVLLILAS